MCSIFGILLSESDAVIETIAYEVGQQVSEDLEKIKPSNLLGYFYEYLPDILKISYQFIIILLLFFIGRKFISFVLKISNSTMEKFHVDTGVRKFLISTIKWSSYSILVFLLAERLGVNSTSIVAVIGSAGIAIGLALQGSLANLAGGILILLTKPFVVGDYINCNGIEGTVKMIDLVYTVIVSMDNKKITIPNGTLSNSLVTNLTAYPLRRIDLQFNITYTTDLLGAKELIKSCYEEHEKILDEPAVVTYLDSLSKYSLVVGARGWCKTADFTSTKWELTEQIKLMFDKEGIKLAHVAADPRDDV